MINLNTYLLRIVLLALRGSFAIRKKTPWYILSILSRKVRTSESLSNTLFYKLESIHQKLYSLKNYEQGITLCKYLIKNTKIIYHKAELNTHQSAHWYALNKTDLAMYYMDLAEKQIANEKNCEDIRAYILSTRGDHFYSVEQYKEAISNLEPLLNLLNYLPESIAIARTLSLADSYFKINRFEQSGIAFRKAKGFINLIDTSSLELHSIKAEIILGLTASLIALNRHSEALFELLHEKKSILQSQLPPFLKSSILLQIGSCHFFTDNHAQCLNYTFQAIAMDSSKSNLKIAYNNLILALINIGRKDLAKRFFEEAEELDLLNSVETPREISLIYSQFAMDSLNTSNSNLSSIKKYISSKDFENSSKSDQATFLKYSAKSLINHDYEASLKQLSQAIELATECMQKELITELHATYVQVLLAQNQTLKALVYLDQNLTPKENTESCRLSRE